MRILPSINIRGASILVVLLLNFMPASWAGAASWVTNAPLPDPVYYTTATVLQDGRVLVAGGYDGAHYSANAEVYDPASDVWTPTAPMLAGRYKHTATLLPDGKVLVAGGDNQAYYFNTSEIYDPAAGQWSPAATLNAARNNFVSALLTNGNLLITGGQGPSGFLAESEIYTSSNITMDVASPIVPIRPPTNGFQFTFTNTPDVSFLVYRSASLSVPAGGWTIIGGPTEVSPGVYEFTDSSGLIGSRQFYRIRAP